MTEVSYDHYQSPTNDYFPPMYTSYTPYGSDLLKEKLQRTIDTPVNTEERLKKVENEIAEINKVKSIEDYFEYFESKKKNKKLKERKQKQDREYEKSGFTEGSSDGMINFLGFGIDKMSLLLILVFIFIIIICIVQYSQLKMINELSTIMQPQSQLPKA
jgi:hypothetical protein